MNLRAAQCAYLLFTTALLILNGWFVSFHPWFGDFWHHAALIDALKSDMWPSRDPFLPDVRARIPYWPYEAAIAAVSRVLNVSAVSALAAMSFVNLGLLLFSLMMVGKSAQRAAAYAPILSLLLLGAWGTNPPNFSAFLHARVFFFVLSYPSTFAFSLTLLAASLIAPLEKASWSRTTVAALLGVLIVLCHPITFIFYTALCLNTVLKWRKEGFSRVLLPLALLIAAPLVFWGVWPLFPLSTFVIEPHFAADPHGAAVYQSLWGIAGIALCGAVPFFFQLRERVKPPVYSMLFLCSVFVFGYAFSHWNYGRVIAYIVFLLHGAIAAEASRISSPSEARTAALLRGASAWVIVAFAAGMTVFTFTRVFTLLAEQRESDSLVSARVLSAAKSIGKEGIILADAEISKVLPALGAHVMVFDVPPFFRNRYDLLRAQQQQFFSGSMRLKRACEIISENFISSVIIDQKKSEESDLERVLAPVTAGEARRLENHLIQIKLEPAACARLDAD